MKRFLLWRASVRLVKFGPKCYELKSLGLEQLLYWVTQENSIEIPLQSSLPYILLPMVHAYYCTPDPNHPYVEHKANMCYLCYITSLVLDPFTKFCYVLWSVLWLCHQIVTDVTAWPINPNPSYSKNWKLKNKLKRK